MEYREFVFNDTGKRHFSLSEDSISIVGNRRRSQATLLLKGLEPEYQTVRQRSPAFVVGLGGLVVALVLFVCRRVFNSWDPIVLAVIIAGSSPLLLISSWRKTEHAVFKNTTGVDAISIARAGPDSSSFNLFVDELSRRIRQAKDEEGDHVD